MKPFPVRYRRSAQRDIQSIFDYVAEASGSFQTAQAYIKRLRDRCMKIADAPFGGVAREDIAAGIRMAVFERSVVILYLVDAETIWITTVVSGAKDYAALSKTRN